MLDQLSPDFDEGTRDLWRFVQPFTMTSPERIFALRQSVQYIVRHGIAGDIVECGIWKGGSMMAIARTLQECGVIDRNLLLFDTFDGMTPPTREDVDINGAAAAGLLSESAKQTSSIWAYAALEEVRDNLRITGYPEDRMFFIKGKVEDTIPERAPDQIALLRLDTDWYESTSHELLHLYPRVSQGGVIIIDDYGHWAGARKAVDHYMAKHNLKILLHRIDYTGRIFMKPS